MQAYRLVILRAEVGSTARCHPKCMQRPHPRPQSPGSVAIEFSWYSKVIGLNSPRRAGKLSLQAMTRTVGCVLRPTVGFNFRWHGSVSVVRSPHGAPPLVVCSIFFLRLRACDPQGLLQNETETKTPRRFLVVDRGGRSPLHCH